MKKRLSAACGPRCVAIRLSNRGLSLSSSAPLQLFAAIVIVQRSMVVVIQGRGKW